MHTGELRALLVGGVDPHDLPDPTAALAALDAAPFVVSLELRESAVTERADVVLPVAAAVEKAGTFVDWEGRQRPFDAVLRGTNALPDVRVLDVLADAMGVGLGLPDVAAARAELDELGGWDGAHAGVPAGRPGAAGAGQPQRGPRRARHLADAARRGRLQDGEPLLAGTARPAGGPALGGDRRGRRRRRTATAVTVSTDRGEITAPAAGHRHARRRRVAADQLRRRARAAGSAPARRAVRSARGVSDRVAPRR